MLYVVTLASTSIRFAGSIATQNTGAGGRKLGPMIVGIGKIYPAVKADLCEVSLEALCAMLGSVATLWKAFWPYL